MGAPPVIRMTQFTPFNDPVENAILIVATIVLVAGAFTIFTDLDEQITGAIYSPSAYFGTEPAPNDTIVFTQEQVNKLNTISSGSLGYVTFEAERPYCGDVDPSGDGAIVDSIRLADQIEESEVGGVTMRCIPPRSIIIHTQPDYHDGLSSTDRDITWENDVEYTCVQYDTIQESAVSGEVIGINCWKYIPDNEGFLEQAVVIR